jgi:excisionase family DNA binding protein
VESIVLTIGQCADLLQVSQLTIRRRWAAGAFPAPVSIGRVLRWREADVRQWLAAQPTSTRYSEKANS